MNSARPSLRTAAFVSQFGELVQAIELQTNGLIDWLRSSGPDAGTIRLQGLLPNMSVLFGGATNAAFALFGLVGNLLVILFSACSSPQSRTSTSEAL